MAARFDAVVFDLDGTLVDSLDDITDALNHVLGTHGWPIHDRDVVRMLIGEGARNLVDKALPEAERARTDATLEEFRARYAAHLTDRTAPYPGVPAMLRELSRREVPLAVLSNKPDALTRSVVERVLGSGFRAVAGQCEGVPKKPDPAGALRIARELSAEPARTLFVGDSGVDMDTARAAGMVPVGVAWGFRDRAELIEHGAARVLDEPAQLLEMV